MPETITRGSTRIRFEGVFNWNELYSYITEWFNQKKFDYYEEKNVKKPGPYGYEREYNSHSEREESGYIRYFIDVKVHAFHMEDITENNKPANRTGMMIIDIKPGVDLDWQKKWEKGKVRNVRDFFHKYIMQGYIYEQMDKIYYESYKLHEGIKKLLKLEAKYSAY